jgi:hypothetical protein
MRTLMTLWVWMLLGLVWAPSRLLLVGAIPEPSGLGQAGGECYIYLLFSISTLCPFYLSFSDVWLLFQGLLTTQ